ncbi:hypothetical protein [Nonomuraea cavernae]|uniref:hypothetical protein n=1 Tax=Nonomuraea cavernae TaxID=2045107 RepID=UPI0033D09EB5
MDTVKFSGNPSAQLPGLSARIPQVLGKAFDRCGLAEIWTEKRFPQAAGDGYVFGVRPEHVPFLVHPLLDELQQVLQEEDARLRSIDRKLRMRLRASIHLGPVPDSGDAGRDRIGTPTNYTFRLLDSQPIKNAMGRTEPDVTLLAAIVSQRLFDDVVAAGYTATHPSQFAEVMAEVPGKDFKHPAWLYIPRNSLWGDPPPGARVEAAPPGSPGAGTVIHGDNIGGSSHRASGHGTVNVVGGNQYG